MVPICKHTNAENRRRQWPTKNIHGQCVGYFVGTCSSLQMPGPWIKNVGVEYPFDGDVWIIDSF